MHFSGLQDSDRHDGTFQLTSVFDAYSVSMGKLSLESDSAIELTLMHQKLKPAALIIIINQLGQIAKITTDFAFSQHRFSSLCKEDQFLLLKSNLPLYLQYITARYFCSKSGLSQLAWMFQRESLEESSNGIEPIHLLTWSDFAGNETLANTLSMFSLYNDYIDLVDNFFPFAQSCSGLVANLVLFHTDESFEGRLKDLSRVRDLFSESRRLAENEMISTTASKLKFNTSSLFFILKKMRNVFERLEISIEESYPASKVPKLMSIRFTDTEELWLQEKFGQVQKEFSSVLPSRELLMQTIGLLSNTPPTMKQFSANILMLLTERVRRVLKLHQEFEFLRDFEQGPVL